MYAGGDYFVQEIVLKPVEDKILNKYGRMRRAFLQKQNPTPDKETDAMAWVRHMNLLREHTQQELDERNELHNRSMHISRSFNKKVDIESEKVDIESVKVDIRNKIMSFSDRISEKTINHTINIFLKCGTKEYFGRTVIEEITGLKASGASKLIKLLLDSNIIVPVSGHGKGKYRFL